ncbi:hypothetical protein ACTFH7_02065 [Clostridium cagae]|uniref:hypothetical protein n=1 Tax=Clostridium cagae TaxID=2080751 RepID=UPI0013FC527B|nr:hypothetical protein [Clostridium botulinum]
MIYADFKNTYDEFVTISREFLCSNEINFECNLNSFTTFCDSNDLISQILESIINIDFDGIKYFSQKSNPQERFNLKGNPKTRYESLKASYDVLWYPNLTSDNLINYAVWALCPATRNIDETLLIGINDISNKLISYIEIELKKLITNSQKESNASQINFNIQNADNSIIGTQSTATINNSSNLDDLKQLIEQNAYEDKEDLKQLIDTLKTITENNMPVSKGTLAKFSEAFEKHSWIAGSIASTLLGWLIGK